MLLADHQDAFPTARNFAISKPVVTTFPWVLFLLSWAILFGLQHQMDAPLQNGSGAVSDAMESAQTGRTGHQILTLTLGALGLFLLSQRKMRLNLKGTVVALLVAYVGWIMLSATWSDDPFVTVRRELGLMSILMFSAGCASRMNENTLSLFAAGIAIINIVPGVIAEMHYGTLQPLATGFRFGGTVHPNIQAASLSLAAIILCWRAWQLKGLSRILLYCGSLVLFGLIIETGSRTSLLALVIALGSSVILIAVRSRKSRVWCLTAAVATIPMLCVAGLAISSGILRPDAVAIFDTIRNDRDEGDVTDLTGRVTVWQTCLTFAAERPLLGFGYGAFWSAKRIGLISDELHWPIVHGHSAYLDQLLALGAIGALLYVLLLLACASTCVVRFINHQDGYGAWSGVLLFMIIHNATESITVLPTFPNLVFTLVSMHLAITLPSTKTNADSCA